MAECLLLGRTGHAGMAGTTRLTKADIECIEIPQFSSLDSCCGWMLSRASAMPEKWCNDRDGDNRNQQKKQRRLLQPCDGRDPKRQYDADHTDAPRSDVNASREGPQCEHRQCCKSTSIGVHHPGDIGHKHKTHRHKHRPPMQFLRPDKMQALLSIFGVSPPSDD